MEQTYEMRHFCAAEPPNRHPEKYYAADRDWDGGLDTEGLDISQLDSYINDSNSDTMYFGDLGNSEEMKHVGNITPRDSPSRHQLQTPHPLHHHSNTHIHQRQHSVEVVHSPSVYRMHGMVERMNNYTPSGGGGGGGHFISINLHNHDPRHYRAPYYCHHLPDSPPDSASEPPYSPDHPNLSPNQKNTITELYTSQTSTPSLLHMGGYGSPMSRAPQGQPQQVHLAHSHPPQGSIQQPASVMSSGIAFPHSQHQGVVQSDSTPAAPLAVTALSPHGTSLYAQMVAGSIQSGAEVPQNATKKRKTCDMGGIQGHGLDIKQEPDQTSSNSQSLSSHNQSHSQLSSGTSSGIGQSVQGQSAASSIGPPVQSSGMTYHIDEEDFSMDTPSGAFMDPSYQCIRFQPFQQPSWGAVCDSSLKELSIVTFRVDADKGFNFSYPDDAFVCQKKNHFQVTTHIQMSGEPFYFKASEGLRKIDEFRVHFYGVKTESPSQSIRVEQSQSDRSKRAFHPANIDVCSEKVNKLTVGRLHFSETTSNNMRKKGKPNPDQRYFYLVVALHAHCADTSYSLIAHASEKIIVRASNPGQFESDVEYTFQRGCFPESIYHMGRVGINTDRPDEALTIHGNVKIIGQLLQPSDIRAKENIQEVDTKEQLNNVRKLRVVKYGYKPNFALNVGLSSNELNDTGVIAQEVREVIPDAVRETGDVQLANGEKIKNFLVVNKDRIYMENVGAVKELCKVTGNLESRIGELERMNSRLKRIDSFKSTTSSSTRTSVTSQMSSVSHHDRRCRSAKLHRPIGGSGNVICSYKLLQISSITSFCIMAFCLIAMATIYIMDYQERSYRNNLTSATNSLNYTIIPHSSHTTSIPFNFTMRTSPFSTELFPSISSQTPARARSTIDGTTYILQTTTESPLTTYIVTITSQGRSMSSVSPATNGTRPPVLGIPENCKRKDHNCQVFCCSSSPPSEGRGSSGSSITVTRRYRLSGRRSTMPDRDSELITNKVYTTDPYIYNISSTEYQYQEFKPIPSKKSGDLRFVSLGSRRTRPRYRRPIGRMVKQILTKRSTHLEQGNIVPQVTIVELDSVVSGLYCLNNSPDLYQMCKNQSSYNYTYSIPISKYMPHHNLTLQFQFEVGPSMHSFRFCPDANASRSRTNRCSSISGQDNRHNDVSPMARNENIFNVTIVNIGKWQQSSYKYRLSLNPDSRRDPCGYPATDMGTAFMEFIFMFYRVCDS